MGKHEKNGTRALVNRDTFLRINFLYQAAYEVFTSKSDNVELVRFYIFNLRSIAKKYVLRIHPSIKRTLCKKCCMLLIPGITAIVRHKSKRHSHTVVTCQDCSVVKRFSSVKEYKLWIERVSQLATSNMITENVHTVQMNAVIHESVNQHDTASNNAISPGCGTSTGQALVNMSGTSGEDTPVNIKGVQDVSHVASTIMEMLH